MIIELLANNKFVSAMCAPIASLAVNNALAVERITMRNKRGSPAVKQKHAGSQSSPATSIGGSYILDRMLVPRIEMYAKNNSIDDHAEVADHLRRSHREYQRKQLGPFRGMVAKAIAVVQRSGGSQKAEPYVEVSWRLQASPTPGAHPCFILSPPLSFPCMR